MSQEEFGVYAHVPFCTKRCPYCAFVLIESDGSLHAKFVERITREIRESPHRPWRAATLYFGGGTPSLLEPAEIARITEAVGPVEGEITLEANPENLTLDRLKGFRDAGINRLSIGIQSLHDDELRLLGRTHTADQARFAHDVARLIFRNVSIDLIFGLPGQKIGRWRESLEQAQAWRPEHISLYGLTYEKGTEFERADFKRLEEGEEAGLYSFAMGWLKDYHHYEISNFALPGFESAHNRGYWSGRPYLGFGPGAHSYIPHRRWSNISNVREYLERDEAIMTREELTVGQRMLERVFLGLRQDTGVDLSAFREEFGVDFLTRFQPQVAEVQSHDLAVIEDDHFRLSRAGMLMADWVTGKFA